MNKTQLMSLNDYMTEPTSINLKLFTLSINSNAKYKVAELKALVDKYQKEQTKLRLNAIELYLGREEKSAKVLKSKQEKAFPKSPLIDYLPKGIDKEKLDILNEMKRKYVSNLKRTGSKTAIEENETLHDKIQDMEDEMGLRFDYKNIPKQGVEESERCLVLSILGDWENPKSLAYELLYGNRSSFQLNNPAIYMLGGGINQTLNDGRGFAILPAKSGAYHLIGLLEKFSGKKARQFNIVTDFDKSSGQQVLKFSESQIANSWDEAQQELQGYGKQLDKLAL